MVSFQEKNISFLNNIFALFLSYCITDLARLNFERLTCKFKELEKAEKRSNYLINNDDNLHLQKSEFKTNFLLDFESSQEEKCYQQSRRSIFYCLEDFENTKQNSKTRKTSLEKNDLYCLQFGCYLLNNWTSLPYLWSNAHLRDQVKHVQEKPYLG